MVIEFAEFIGALLCSFTLGVLVSQKDLLKKLF